MFYLLADVNECLNETTVNKCSTNAECINTEGSYICECPSGYMLLADQRTCDGKLSHLIVSRLYALVNN